MTQDRCDPFVSGAEIWVDVGGTFTDCFLATDGELQGVKVLSSGLVRGRIASIPDIGSILLAGLPIGLTNGFLTNSKLSLIDDTGAPIPLGTITGSDADSGRLEIDSDAPDWRECCHQNGLIEIDCGLEAPVLAARMLLRSPPTRPLPRLNVRLGTTRGTNALLTRRGANTAFLVTAGFGDILEIGEQDRPDLFALEIHKPPPLTRTVIEVSERLDHHGGVICEVDAAKLRLDLESLHDRGIDSLAVCLLHSHINDAHERVVEQVAREVGFREISLSSEVAPLIKLVARSETTTLDAYLNPILSTYVARLWQQFGGVETCHLRLMTSGGHLVAPAAFRGATAFFLDPLAVLSLWHMWQERLIPTLRWVWTWAGRVPT